MYEYSIRLRLLEVQVCTVMRLDQYCNPGGEMDVVITKYTAAYCTVLHLTVRFFKLNSLDE
jgi:hypothetical protein